MANHGKSGERSTTSRSHGRHFERSEYENVHVLVYYSSTSIIIQNLLFYLGRTNSVDATVANLVEGVVPFTPEPIVTRVESTSPGPSPQPGPSDYRPTGVSSQVQQVSASTFGKSMHERGLSLQERKQRLLREAQLRYCERHGLQIPGINC